MKKSLYIMIILTFGLILFVSGCRKQEEAVIHVETEVKAQYSSDTLQHEIDQQKAFSMVEPDERDPGTFLKEETVSVYTDEGEQKHIFYRMQGSYGYSIAYDKEFLCYDLNESVDCLYLNGAPSPEESDVKILISENSEMALEELADQIVLGCKQECLVEEITLGDEEYSSIWINYTENTSRGSQQVEYYLIGFETRVLEVQVICKERVLEEYDDDLQIILSTVHMDSIAEG